MKKYILAKDFLEIAKTYGIFQNLSGDSNIEITDNINEQRILLKPFQKVQINQNENILTCESLFVLTDKK